MFCGIVGTVIWYELNHPCTRYENRKGMCGGDAYCSFVNTDGSCLEWRKNPTYECTTSVCIERSGL